MNIGDEREIKVTFPEEYHAEELKGKDAIFEVKVHEIKEKSCLNWMMSLSKISANLILWRNTGQI